MKYGYTIGYVDNVVETITFYKKAFGFVQKFIRPENDYAELISGETTIAFASISLGNSNLKQGLQSVSKSNKPFGLEMAFISEHIESDFQKAIDAGAHLYEPLGEKPWGQKVGYVLDNNGFLIEICSPMQSNG